MTSLWLRCVVYERCHSTLAVFLFSAFWHGFYPGYYLTFLGGAMFIHGARLASLDLSDLLQGFCGILRLWCCVFGLAGARKISNKFSGWTKYSRMQVIC